MKLEAQEHIQKTLRKRLSAYRYANIEQSFEASVHVNAIEMALGLVEYAQEKGRPIKTEEETWFEAGIHLYRVFEDSEWQDLSDLYNQLVDFAKQNNFYRK